MEIRGEYIKTIYRRKDGFTKFLFLPENETVAILCFGVLSHYTEHSPLILIGYEQEEEWRGVTQRVFVVEHCLMYWNNKKVSKQYVTANLGIGMGKAAAEKILTACDWNVENLIRNTGMDKTLAEKTGLPVNKITVFLSSVRSSEVTRMLYETLCPYGCTYKEIERAYAKYGNKSLEKLEENPYYFGRMTGISFGIIDLYGRDHGWFFADKARVRWIMQSALKRIPATGSTYACMEDFLAFCRKEEMVTGAYDDRIPEILFLLEGAVSGSLKTETVNGKVKIYPSYLWEAEESITKSINKLMRKTSDFISADKIDNEIRNEKELDEDQKQCYRMFAKTGICIMTGGPGTGKTTTIKKLISFFQFRMPEFTYALCAPTGRAAERITEATGIKASTIHKLLEYSSLYGQEAGPERNASNPLSYDLVVADEFSMVGTQLFSQLLEAMKENSLLILVGDPNQLKSVEAGKVMEDLMKSGKIPIFRLTTIHRQQGSSTIIDNAVKICNGRTDLVTDSIFHILRKANSSEILQTFRELSAELKEKYGLMGYQAIGIMKKGDCGVNNLNLFSQMMFHEDEDTHVYVGGQGYCLGDKIMTVRNNYEQGYMNGDIGILSDCNRKNIYMKCDEKKLIIDAGEEEDLTLAYAITTHKSQGSEADAIIFVIPADTPEILLENALIYVGVTRAKKEIYILTEGNALERGILNKRTSMRNTGLVEKLSVIM